LSDEIAFEVGVVDLLIQIDDPGFPKTGNGLTAQAVRKPQCFKDIGGLFLFSVAPWESWTRLDGARFQAEELSGVSRKDATG
jgi:hypothetical protein